MSESAATNATSATKSVRSIKPKPIGVILVEQGVLVEEQIQQALAYQKEEGNQKLLGEVLIELGMVTEDKVCEVLAQAYGVPYAKVTPQLADPSVLDKLPRDFIESNSVLPLFFVEGILTVAICEPANVFLIEEVERVADSPIQIVATTSADIAQALKGHLPDQNVFVIDDIVDDGNLDSFEVLEEDVTDLSNLENLAGQSPVIKLVNYLIYSAVKDGASDIHIEPGDKQLRVRLRVDGRLFEKISPPHHMHAALTSRVKIMAALDISERRLPQDGGIHVSIDSRPIDLRVSTMPGKFGEKVVIRVIDNSTTEIGLERLGFAYDMLQKLKAALHEPNGITLVTGPTGSGKSTTLYSMLGEIKSDEVNICTVEDPVEFSLQGVNQFQVNEKAGFTFASALRALLRQDPDIIMLGEVRDLETARIAVQAALTGHQVLSTLHTNDAPSAVTRLANIGVESFLVAASLRAILAQRLLRKICADCKEPMELSKIHRIAIEESGAELESAFRGAGCKKCRGIGYKGRVGAFELFIPDEEILSLITQGAPLPELKRAAVNQGFVNLRQDGMEKVKAGLTTIDEVLYATAG